MSFNYGTQFNSGDQHMDFQTMLQQFLQQQGQQGQNQMQGGQNYFNPPGGNGAYSSNKGMMGGANPMMGGSMGGSMGSGMGGSMGGMGGAMGGMGGVGDIASGLFNMFGAQDPSAAGDKYLSGIENGMGKYLNPYVDAGKSAMSNLQGQYSSLLSNPTGMMNQIGSTFQQSPGYKFQTDQAMNAANQAGAASGMAGSPMQQQNIAGTVNGLANQDYYNYLNHGIGMYDQGLSGMSHIMDNGYGAAGQMSQGVMQQLLMQAQNAAMGAANSNSMMGGGIGSIIGGLGEMGMF